MEVAFTEFMEVKNFLMQQHIIVSQEWTEACISFVKQEQGHTMPLQNLKKSVYQQWLVADLEEIACSSLPRELPTAQKMALSNSFALQVQGIRDISKPAYSQLKQLEGSVNCNEEFSSAPKAAIPEWEAKPTRMLLLSLTDGCTCVQGMEYRTISFLSPNLSPGIKVLIKGPIECRFGVMLLTADNIRILGGVVESKHQQFSRENILKEQLQIEREDVNHEDSTANSVPVSRHSEGTDNYRTSNRNSYPSVAPHNNTNTGTSHPASLSSENEQNFQRSTDDILDHFESDDDDFAQNIDYEMLDEIENSQRQSINPQDGNDDFDDIWQADEDMIRDVMEFQDRNEEFKMPFKLDDASTSKNEKDLDSSHQNEIFTYLSSVTNNPLSNSLITIKGFIISVLSKLECTPSKGWSLMVKINDGSATVNASLHDKVLENIIGVSAQDMMKKQTEAAKNVEVRKEVMQTISKCKLTLQNYNCFMDVKFAPGEKPCIVKCYPVTKLHIQQLLERVRCHF